jgi:hypothetical protein
MDELNARIKKLAMKFKADPENPELQMDLEQLIHLQGEWVKESFADFLVEGEPGTFSQTYQDRLIADANRPVFISTDDSGHLRSIYLSNKAVDVFLPDLEVYRFLFSELHPSDFWKIEREARLTELESEIWGWFVRGYNLQQIAERVHRPRSNRPMRLEQVSAIFNRTKAKVLCCPTLGWRTCYLQDVMRGRVPDKILPENVINS